MIWFFTPYSFDKRILIAIDSIMDLIGEDDWAVLMDGDTAYLKSDFGHHIHDYIEKYPDTGLFTCYASRCHYQCQRLPDANMDNDSILYWKEIADDCHRDDYLETKVIERRIAGHLMVISKRTWMQIRLDVFRTSSNKKILGVDTKICNAVLKNRLTIRLMKGILILHYMRLKEGTDYKQHLL